MENKETEQETNTSQSQHPRGPWWDHVLDDATRRGERWLEDLARAQRDGAAQLGELSETLGRLRQQGAATLTTLTSAWCDLAAASVRTSRELWSRVSSA